MQKTLMKKASIQSFTYETDEGDIIIQFKDDTFDKVIMDTISEPLSRKQWGLFSNIEKEITNLESKYTSHPFFDFTTR